MVYSTLVWLLGVANTVFWGSLSLLGSLADRSGRWSHSCMVTWSRWNLVIARTRVETRGLEQVRRAGPQVFAVNHQSLMDIFVLAAILPVPFRFVAKRELFDLPFVGWHMRRSGFIAIDRENPRQATRTLLKAAQQVRAGMNALVFPEGTRSRDGHLLPFRGGGFLLATRSQAPVVPVAITGTGQIVAKGSWTVRPATVRVAVGRPIEPAAFGDDRDALAQAVRAEIERNLGEAAPEGQGPTAE